MLQIAVLGNTTINWTTLQEVVQLIARRSVTRPLDNRGIETRGLPEAIVAFAEFQQSDQEYLSVLRDPGSILKHFNISFIMRGRQNHILQFLLDGNISVLDCHDNDELYILTASLLDWKNTVINFSCDRSTIPQQYLAEQIVKEFENLGLGELFSEFSKKPGNGFYLTRK